MPRVWAELWALWPKSEPKPEEFRLMQARVAKRVATRGERTVISDALGCASGLTIRGEGAAFVVVTHASSIATILPHQGGRPGRA